MAPVYREEVGDEEGSVGSSSFKVDPHYTRSSELCCFNLLQLALRILSFEQESDTIGCVFQEGNSGGAEVQLGEMRNTGMEHSYCNSSGDGWQGQSSYTEEVDG